MKRILGFCNCVVRCPLSTVHLRPHVVILSAFLSPFRSGAEACAEEVALQLADRFDVTIITSKLRSSSARSSFLEPGTGNISRVHVIRVGFGHPIDKWLYPILAPLKVRKLRPQLIHAILESYAGLAMVFCRFFVPAAKRLLTCQSTNTSLLLSRMHRSAHRVTVISTVLLERAKKFGRNDAVLIPNGIRSQELRQACERTTKIPGRILFVGRLEKVKGVDTLLQAFSIMRDEGGTAHLRIAGDGSQRGFLESRAEKLGIGSSVTFLGYLSHEKLAEEFAAAEIFCGLSRSEALGNVFLEAQAAGCAVLATAVGGIPDIVRNGETGFLIAPDDPACAAQFLRRLLEERETRETFVRAGLEWVKDYDWKGIAKRYGEIYSVLLFVPS